MWSIGIFLSLIVFVGTPPWTINAFNIETKHYAVYRQEAKSMFGFAVTVYRDRYGRGWAVVGAPEADTSQVGVYRGGAVYRCDIAVDDRCDVIHFDDKGNNHVRNPSVAGGLSQIDNKTLQWFGATVSASNREGGPILACAPRYIWFSVSQPKHDPDDNRWSKESTVGNRREPVGTCWVVGNNFNESQEFSPCRTRYWGYHRQGSCQAGLGAAMSKNGERLFIGAPGSWYWQGQLYSISTAMKFRFVSTTLFTPEAETSGQAFSQPLNSRAKVMFTKEGPANEDDSYMGYSVATGDFVGNGDSGTAVGVPRGSGLRGKVVLFTSNMTNHQNVTGEQMGAYFGYSVASGDIDGDGLDDLIVGAPMYTIPDNPEMTIETGRVYVIYQGTGLEKFRKVDSRDGESNRGRFGLSLASLGDIDRDGYGDFAVGAPYAGPNGRGAVYIFHGSRTGVLEKYSQVIYAEDLDVPVQTFGFSVAGGLDLDGNRYPDMVVGAYESSAAMFFRARPVIKTDSFVVFESDSKLISLDNKNATLSDGTRVTSIPLKACFRYTGEGVHLRHSFNIQYVLDVKKSKNPRMFFMELEGRNTMNHTILVDRDQQFCRTVQVYVAPNIRDKLTSLDAEMRMSLDEERLPDNRRRDPRISLRPILGSTTSRKDTLSIRKNCGMDNVCIPDLQLSVTQNVEKYLLGSGKKFELEVLVQNAGEDAFEATYSLKLPPGIDYVNIERIDTFEVPVQCSAPKQSNNNTLRCDIGNPLPQGQLVNFKVLLQPVTSHGMNPVYEFYMETNSTNPELDSTTEDNVRRNLTLSIWIETDLRVIGESKPKDVYYYPDNYTDTNFTTEIEFGPAVTHNYTIHNQGPSDIVEAEAILIWPAQTLGRDELLYLLEQPDTTGPIACQTANANYLSLKLDQRKRLHLNYPDPSGVILDESQSGKTINIGRELDVDHTSGTQKEEELSSGDSSSIQKSRHHSSSSSANVVTSETRRIQLTTSGDKPDVLTTTYTQNTSGTSSIGTGDLSSGNRGIIFHPETGGDSTVEGGFHTTVQETRFHSPSLEDSHKTQINYSDTLYGGHSISQTENERRYQEHLRRQEDQRRREEEEALRFEEEAKLRRIEEERRYEQRQIEEQERLELQRRRLEEEERRRQQERQNVYGEERRYSTDGYRESSFISGNREETVGNEEYGFRLRNVTSAQELEKVFGTISKESAGYELYSRQGRQYVQFTARFRSSTDRKEYVEFQDGSRFPLQDQYGRQSYISESNEPRDSRFLRIEGQLMIDQEGRGYIVLKDGRRFPLQGSYTYTEERTYRIGGRGEPERNYETKYTTRTHEERKTQERTNTRVYDNREFIGDDGGRDPNALTSRFRRESDMIDIEDFKKFERHRRRPRDADFTADDAVLEGEIDYDSETKAPEFHPTRPCDAAECVTLRCVLGPLKKDQEVTIAARYRINARTLKKIAYKEKIKISTKLIAMVTKQPFIGTPAEKVIKSDEIFTNVEPRTPPAPDVIPLWVVVLSACAGAIILLLLIFLLYKCGFFKRNRPSDAPERQPLNRNGHFHGDDH